MEIAGGPLSSGTQVSQHAWRVVDAHVSDANGELGALVSVDPVADRATVRSHNAAIVDIHSNAVFRANWRVCVGALADWRDAERAARVVAAGAVAQARSRLYYIG